MNLERSAFIAASLMARYPMSWETRLNQPPPEEVRRDLELYESLPLQLELNLQGGPNERDAKI